MSADKQQGTCSVCLRAMQLHGDHPIRHGFSAVGVRHGQHGGYHTGPCAGTGFPHLGISTKGTQWALNREQAFLAKTLAALDRLAGNPDLTWYPKIYDIRGGRPDFSKPVIVKHGDGQQLSIQGGTPSYDYLHRTEKAKLDGQQHAATRAIDAYEKVLASWSPAKYPVTGAAKKIEIVHMERPIKIKTASGEVTKISTCCQPARARRAASLTKTSDPAKVTCKRCRASLGLPAL